MRELIEIKGIIDIDKDVCDKDEFLSKFSKFLEENNAVFSCNIDYKPSIVLGSAKR